MNLRYTIIAGACALVALSSCEMKDELWNKGGDSTEVGLLDLGLSVNSSSSSVTKADGSATQTTTTVSPEGFKVEIKNAEGTYKEYDYASAETSTPIELPVGDYTVYAHSPGEPSETAAYYGKEEAFTVVADQTVKMTVVCTMMNTKFQLNYDPELISTFKSWEITISDGTHNETFIRKEGETATSPDPFFWMLADNVSVISVNFNGVNNSGESVTDSRSLTKEDGSDWGASDALTITVKPEKENADPTGVTGIDITVNLTWNGSSDTVEVKVEDGDGLVKPDPIIPAAPTITYPRDTYTLPDDANEKVNVNITAAGGLASVKVKITGGNDKFANIATTMFGTEAFELIGNTTLASVFESMQIELPENGDKSYDFPISSFFSLLSDPTFGPTDAGKAHTFEITVTDETVEDENIAKEDKNDPESATLSVIVNSTTASE